MSKLLPVFFLLTKLLFCLASLEEERDFLGFGDVTNLLDIKPRKEENRSGPSFLMNAFAETIDEISGVNFTNHKLTQEELDEISKSDTVATFVAQQPNRRRDETPKKVKRIWFDILVVKKPQKLVKTHLRLFRDRSKISDKYRGQKFNLTVSRVETKPEGKKFFYVTSTIIEADFTGWIVLDVTKSFQWWMRNFKSNNEGFRIKTVLMKTWESKKRSVKPELLGIVGFDGPEDKHPFAVGFYEGVGKSFLELQVAHVVKRRTREANIHDFDYEEEYFNYDALNELDQKIYEYKKSVCNLRKINIRLKDIGLDFIISPAIVDVNDCIGKCKYPFPEEANATDHSVLKIQQSIHGISRLNKPGCTPIKYEDRKFLYYGSDNVLISRKFKNVSASQCGCR